MTDRLRAISRQRPGDIITIAFLVFLLGLTIAFYPALPRPKYLISLYSVLILAQVILIRLSNKGKFLEFFYDLIFPTICILAIFDSLEWLVHYINPQDIDPLLIRLDYMILGGHPSLILEKIINPYLTDILQLAYSLYYFVPVGYGAILLMSGQKEDFNRSLFLILLCFYLSYLGYILFPALGPRFYLSEIQTSGLHGFILTEPLQNLLNRLEGIKRDAFPSGHTGITVLVLYLSFRYKRWFFWLALPVVSALIFATVYCRYHYVVDVIAGFGLTIITISLGEWYYGWWEREKARRQF
ncbi:MAG TPA: phosphatase PAP2 family protein [Thermodesulfovibrionales bacterium]|nr:phosphatase PAP2 family protein [Thermodesulfovibrionales bacterium]